MTDWRSISIKLKDALLSSEKWWEHKELLQQVNDLLSQPEDRTPLKWLNLPTRIENALLRNGCDTIERLSLLKSAQILSIKGLGESSIPVIKDSLKIWDDKMKANQFQPSEANGR